MRVGVDFGTTNSAIAYYDGEQLHPILTDPANDNPAVTPSMLYIDRAGQVTVGASAASRYMEQETGRPVRWREHEAGHIPITVASVGNTGGAPIQFAQAVTVLVDEGAQGRLIQSIKTALFNSRYEGTSVFQHYYRVEELIALVLRHLRQAAESETGEAISQLVLGRPVRFSESAQVDSRAESILLKAAHLAGFNDVQLAIEPVGVAHLYHSQSPSRQRALIFDFGGGTLDLTIAEIGGPEAPVILATGGVALGGDDLDRRIMESLLPYFGGGDEGVLPADMADRLLAWQTMPELSRPRYLERIQRLKRSGHQEVMKALETLISRNIGFRLFKEIEQVKKQLSSAESARLDFEFEAVHIHEVISRRRFDRMIAPDVARVHDSIQDLLAQAGLEADAIDTVLRTGGSSLIPAFGNLLGDIFGADRVKSTDPLTSVTGGFAVMAHDLAPAALPPLEIISDLHDDQGALPVYRIRIGAEVYTDRDFILSRVPPPLIDLPAGRLANQNLSELSFCLNQPADLLLAFETSLEQLPPWLRGFTPMPMQIEIEDVVAQVRRKLQLYSRPFEAGLVSLGSILDGDSEQTVLNNYLVILRPND